MNRPAGKKGTSKRGFASMDAQKQREIASKGGQAAHAQGTAHEFSREEAQLAGKRGGEAVSRNRQHMSDIGRRGGEASSAARREVAKGHKQPEDKAAGSDSAPPQEPSEPHQPAQQ